MSDTTKIDSEIDAQKSRIANAERDLREKKEQLCRLQDAKVTPSMREVLQDIGRIIEALKIADRAMALAAAQCGTPNAAEGCRLILRTIAEARMRIRELVPDLSPFCKTPD